jgi:microcystin-dependent protein
MNEQNNGGAEQLQGRVAALEGKLRLAGWAISLTLLCGVLFGSANLAAQEDWAPVGFHIFSAGTPARAEEVNSNFRWLVEQTQAAENAARTAIPVGTIVAYGGGEVPEGWLLCDGSIQAMVSFPELAQALGNAWGEPTETTFVLPDLRGQFLRGLDSGAGRDPDSERTVGSYQRDAMQRITASLTRLAFDTASANNASGAFSLSNIDSLNGGTNANGDSQGTLTFDSAASSAAKVSDVETRPTNAAVQFIIKY